jgi:hypothetical protein
VRAGVIPDASFIWWAMRPSTAHPTLELRAPDCCTRLEDTLAIAALYRTLARRVFFNSSLNADLTAVSRAVVVENNWRAQRYGIHGTFVDEARPREVPFARWLDQVIEEAADDAAALDCLDEVVRCRAIVADGTSADAQLAVYRQARHKGAEREEALAAVSRWLAETTLGPDGFDQQLRAEPGIRRSQRRLEPLRLLHCLGWIGGAVVSLCEQQSVSAVNRNGNVGATSGARRSQCSSRDAKKSQCPRGSSRRLAHDQFWMPFHHNERALIAPPM